MISLKRPLNSVGGAVVLNLLAAHDHRNARSDGNASGDGESGVGDAAYDVVASRGRDGSDETAGELAEEGRIGHNESEVHVDWGGDAGFELEVTEFHGGDVVELQNQRLHCRW